jgi:hypothetical protein
MLHAFYTNRVKHVARKSKTSFFLLRVGVEAADTNRLELPRAVGVQDLCREQKALGAGC